MFKFLFNSISVLFLGTILLTVSSCGQKETIIPLYQPESAAEQQQNRNSRDDGGQIGPNNNGQGNREEKIYYVRGKYYLSDIQVNRAVNGPILVSDFGNLLADIIVRVGGQFEVDMDPIPLDVSNLDKELVKSIVIKSVKFEILDNPKKANLKFIRKIQIFMKKEETTDGEEDHEILLMNYDRNNDYDVSSSKKCYWKCVNLNLNKLNIVKYIGNDEKLIIRPSVKIGSVPKEKFLLGGYMEFEIGLALPL